MFNVATAVSQPSAGLGGTVTLEDVYRAREIIAKELATTPFVAHPLLDSALGCRAYVKLENSHDIGSFKIRGSLNLLATMSPATRARGLVTATKGNHGQSLARAAAHYGTRCTIFVPHGNNRDKNRAMTALGADVRVVGEDFDAAWAAAAEFAEVTGARAVHPAREGALIAGIGTMALEILEAAVEPLDYLFVPIGGGSIAAAMAVVFSELSPHTQLIGVQSALAPAMHRAFHKSGEHSCPVGPTVADGLAVRESVDFTLNLMRRSLSDIVLVEEHEILDAMRLYAVTLHQMVEGAGAVPLAAARRMADSIAGRSTGLVVTGGNVEADTFIQALQRPAVPVAPPMHSLTVNEGVAR